MGDVHPFGNPHFWLDPENGRIIARAIAARLSEIDPPGAAEYKANLAAFETKLTDGEKRWEAALAPYAGTEVVTYHNSWPNFLKRFKLAAAGYVEPKPGIPPSPSHTVELIDMMRAKKVPVILMEPYFDRKTPAQIAEKTGATLLIFIPSVGGVPEATDYFALFDYDVKMLANALAAKKGGAQ
jgi:ABC-type Zn uptake system ZnuABC Zn-binding protein ZnuA